MMWRFREHPNMIKVFAYSTTPVAIVMKLHELGDAKAFVYGKGTAAKEFPYSKATVLSLIRQYCSGIAYMHQSGFSHNDIKPGNILLDVDVNGQLMPVICDFGISRVINASSLKVAAFNASEVRGASTAYAAPEVLYGLRNRVPEQDPRNWMARDIFALGISIEEMIQRVRPWGKKSAT